MDDSKQDKKAEELRARLNLAIPGLKESIGAGDVVHKITHALGMKHCSECERRKAALNRMAKFTAKLRK